MRRGASPGRDPRRGYDPDSGHDEQPWVVRPVTGQNATKAYRCPGCQQTIPVGTPHVVAWPGGFVAGDPTELRRHWHTACWRRGPLAGRG